MIKIINYGLGNIKSFINVYDKLNVKVEVVSSISDFKNTSKLILPGVGSFDQAMILFDKSGMRDEVEKLVLIEKVPVLGICVGMQMLANSSEEGKEKGLGWIDGSVRLFDASKINYKTKLPHMGWNTIIPEKTNRLMSGFDEKSRFYFLHSYFFEHVNQDNIIATTSYGIQFASAVSKDNIFGVQFHPEKSHSNGVRLLENFAKL